jgi:hypothetical protein
LDGALDFGEFADVGFAADGGVDEFPAFPTGAVLEDFHAGRRGGGERIHILHQAGVAGDFFAGLVAEDLMQRGDFGIVGGAGPEILGFLPVSRHHKEERQQRHRQPDH